EPMDLHVAGDRRQLLGAARVAAGRPHAPAVGGVLPHELQADAAIAAGDERCRHGYLLRRGAAARFLRAVCRLGLAAGLRAVTSISMRMRGSMRPAMMAVLAGRISPK